MTLSWGGVVSQLKGVFTPPRGGCTNTTSERALFNGRYNVIHTGHESLCMQERTMGISDLINRLFANRQRHLRANNFNIAR